MQNVRTHHFNEGPVTTGQVAIGYFVAFEPKRPDVRGRGETEWSAIADLNRAIKEAGCDDEDEADEPRRRATQEQIWDRARDYRKTEAA